MFNQSVQQLRSWINLLNESINFDDSFTEYELNLLERYGYPINGFIEAIKDATTSTEELDEIKNFLKILLDDGGLWGETFNSHDLRTSRMKQKIIKLYSIL
jgi:hypothetical protein